MKKELGERKWKKDRKKDLVKDSVCERERKEREREREREEREREREREREKRGE